MKKESKSEVGVTVDDGNDSDSSGYSLSVTLMICYSEKSEWILNMEAIYHVCPKQEWFASLEKLDGVLVSFGGGHTFHTEGICTVRIKLSNGMIREFRDVRYVPQLNKNLISVGALEAQGLRETLEKGVLKNPVAHW